MNVTKAVVAVVLGIGSTVCVGQTANTWYPIDSSASYHVKSVWYDLRTFGSLSRIGTQFVEGGPVFFYYFSPGDSVQLQKAHAIYASLLTAVSTGVPTFVYITGPDAYATGNWDFISIQLGPN